MDADITLIAISVLVLGLVLYFWHLAERERTKTLAGVARRVGLQFRAEHDKTLLKRVETFQLKPWGAPTQAWNLLHGRYGCHQVQVFDYECVIQAGKTTVVVTATFFVVWLGKSLPNFILYPESVIDQVVQAIGLEDIDFDSVEFSRAFVVKSKDKKFAYDVCHVLFMEHFLARPQLAVEIQGEYLALVKTPRVEPDELVKHLDEIIAVRELMPAYLLT